MKTVTAKKPRVVKMCALDICGGEAEEGEKLCTECAIMASDAGIDPEEMFS